MNKYLVMGTRNQTGTLGLPENFYEELETKYAQQAYKAVLTRPGFEHIHIIAIKMKCLQCRDYHIVVPPELYNY